MLGDGYMEKGGDVAASKKYVGRLMDQNLKMCL